MACGSVAKELQCPNFQSLIWRLLYGGLMERPALVHPLLDVKVGKIDIIIVCKVDRLT